jgi:hypothetical protein
LKKKDPVVKKTESPKKENSQADQVIIYTHIIIE